MLFLTLSPRRSKNRTWRSKLRLSLTDPFVDTSILSQSDHFTWLFSLEIRGTPSIFAFLRALGSRNMFSSVRSHNPHQSDSASNRALLWSAPLLSSNTSPWALFVLPWFSGFCAKSGPACSCGGAWPPRGLWLVIFVSRSLLSFGLTL